jgi:putative tricarboxylic transport membrane protein
MTLHTSSYRTHPLLCWLTGPQLSGLLLVALAAAAAWLARDLPVVHRGTVGPGAFPWLMAGGLALAGLALTLRQPSPPPLPRSANTGTWVLLGGMLTFPLAVPWLGTLPALALCGTLIARATSGSWRRACVIGPGLATMLHAVLMWGLGTPLPWWLP